jgi:hypothetical protein
MATRARVEVALVSGLAAMEKLDALISNQLRRDPVTLAVWQCVRTLGAVRRVRGTAAAPAPSAPDLPPAAPDVPALDTEP